MKKYSVIFLVLWCCYSCDIIPQRPLSYELKQELFKEGRYFNYVKLLNTSLNSNNVNDLSLFLSLDYFNTLSTGSEHGKILLELLQKKGDAFFLQALTILNQSERTNVQAYLMIGLDNQQQYSFDYYIKHYPKTFESLNLEAFGSQRGSESNGD